MAVFDLSFLHVVSLTNSSSFLAIRAGFKDSLSTHSCSVGGATALAALGYSDVKIGMLGRWTSDCFKIYTRVVEPWAKAAALEFGKMTNLTDEVVKAGMRIVETLKNNIDYSVDGLVLRQED